MRLLKIIGSLLLGALIVFAATAARAQSRYDVDQAWIKKTIRSERHKGHHHDRRNLTVEYRYRDRWRDSPVRRHYYSAPKRHKHRHYDPLDWRAKEARRHEHSHRDTRVYGVAIRRLDVTGAIDCYPNVEAWSVEANTEDGAWRDAQRNWENQVRAMYGERFMDIANSKAGGERQCWISSGNQSVAGRVAETVGRVVGSETVDGRKHRCRVMLQPCQAPKEANPAVKGDKQ